MTKVTDRHNAMRRADFPCNISTLRHKCEKDREYEKLMAKLRRLYS